MTAEYDKIIHEAEKAYKYQKSVENPYAFHDALNFAKRELGLLTQEEANARTLQIAEKAVGEERKNWGDKNPIGGALNNVLSQIKTEIEGES